MGESSRKTDINDIPDPILFSIIASISCTRYRNSISLVCRRWLIAERKTRTSLSLRTLSHNLPSLPISSSFPSLSHLDLSTISPWSHPLPTLLPTTTTTHFPLITSLTLCSRPPLSISLPPLSPLFPLLSSIKLIRYHPRPSSSSSSSLLASDLSSLFTSFPLLSSIDLSEFYHWTDDLPPLLSSHPSTPSSLTSLNLMTTSLSLGYNSTHLSCIASSCPSLTSLYILCNFDTSSHCSVDDSSILSLASNCTSLSTLHLHDASSLLTPSHYSKVTSSSLIPLFASLPSLHDLSLHICTNVSGSRQAVEALASYCTKLTYLNLSHFFDASPGVALCSGLRRLSLKNSPDVAGMISIAEGCTMLTALRIHGCAGVTSPELRRAVWALRRTLVEVSVSRCPGIDVVDAVEPIRGRIQKLHADCWSSKGGKKREEEEERKWEGLRELSLWAWVGEEMPEMEGVGLGECPNLEEVRVKVEGDGRGRRMMREGGFGLGGLRRYRGVRRLRVDCGGVVGNALTAPGGEMDVSEWERYYLRGIAEVERLEQVEYWPPYDRDLNQRSVSLVGVGLLAECTGLRSLLIHGSLNEHLSTLLLHIPGLRDVQLKDDHFPASDMPFHSSRFHDTLYSRRVHH